MVGSSDGRTPVAGTAVPPPIQLVRWPLRDDGTPPWLVLLGVLALAYGAGHYAQSTGMGIVALLALLFVFWKLWVPVHYEVGSRGITQKFAIWRRHVPWSSVTRFEVRYRGVVFFIDAEPHPLAAFRGLYVPCAREAADVVKLAEFFIRLRDSAAGSTVGSRSRNSL